jgi:GxxExxY protein
VDNEKSNIGLSEPDHDTDRLARSVIGAVIEVHRNLGPGFLESIYEEALAVELQHQNIPFERQAGRGVSYRGIDVGQYRMDFLVDRKRVVEIKAVEKLSNVHQAQLIAYLKATHLQLGLLINFNEYRLKNGIKRLVNSYGLPLCVLGLLGALGG